MKAEHINGKEKIPRPRLIHIYVSKTDKTPIVSVLFCWQNVMLNFLILSAWVKTFAADWTRCSICRNGRLSPNRLLSLSFTLPPPTVPPETAIDIWLPNVPKIYPKQRPKGLKSIFSNLFSKWQPILFHQKRQATQPAFAFFYTRLGINGNFAASFFNRCNSRFRRRIYRNIDRCRQRASCQQADTVQLFGNQVGSNQTFLIDVIGI